MFKQIGIEIDSIIQWLFSFEGNDIQILLWSGFVGMLLVFVVEFLRKPKIDIDLLNCAYNFNLPNNGKYIHSKNWKVKVAYRKSILNRLLFRYSLNNLKVRAHLISADRKFRIKYQLKADTNPNVYEERDVPSVLNGINLIKGEYDLFPVLNNSKLGWLPFEVWIIFLNTDNRHTIEEGTYFLKIIATSDQSQSVKYFRIYIDNQNKCEILKMAFLEKIRIKFCDQDI